MPNPELAGSRWQVPGGFRTPELLLIQRALSMYISNYQQMKGAAVHPGEKQSCQEYMDAAEALAKRFGPKNLVRVTREENGKA